MKRNRLGQRLSVLVVLGITLVSAAALADPADQGYPENPFARDHYPLPAKERGAAPGQVQFSVLGALVSGQNNDDLYFGGKIGSEKILNEYGGIRFTAFQDVMETNGQSLEHKITSFRSGPAWHFFPFSAFDVGSYLEAGVAVLDLVDGKTGTKAPEVAVGGFIDFHVNSTLFVRAELERTWCNLDVNDAVVKQHRTAAMLGFGFAF